MFYALGHGCHALADALEWMYLTRFAQGIGAALLLITVDTITTDLTEADNRPAEMGRNIETQTSSSIVGFTLVGAAPLIAWQYSFGFYAICALAAFVYLVIKFEQPEVHHSDESDLEITPGLKRFLIVVFVAGFTNALIQPIYLIYLQDKFLLSAQQMTWAFLPAAIVFAALPSRLGKLNQKFGTVNLLKLGFVISGITYTMLPFLNSVYVFVALYTLSALGWAVSDPARKALTASLGNGQSTGRNFGITELNAGIGATIGPAISGYLYDNQGPDITFFVNGILLLATALLAHLLLSKIVLD